MFVIFKTSNKGFCSQHSLKPLSDFLKFYVINALKIKIFDFFIK